MLALFLLREIGRPSPSAWLPYLLSLPKPSDLACILSEWSDASLALLCDEGASRASAARRVQLRMDFESVRQAVVAGTQDPAPDVCAIAGALLATLSWSSFRWARACVSSRAFVDGLESDPLFASADTAFMLGLALVPGGDMFNHDTIGDDAAPPCDTEWLPSDVGGGGPAGAYVVRAARTYAVGEQVLISYGERSMRDLLENYGFVPPFHVATALSPLLSSNDSLLTPPVGFVPPTMDTGTDSGVGPCAPFDALSIRLADVMWFAARGDDDSDNDEAEQGKDDVESGNAPPAAGGTTPSGIRGAYSAVGACVPRASASTRLIRGRLLFEATGVEPCTLPAPVAPVGPLRVGHGDIQPVAPPRAVDDSGALYGGNLDVDANAESPTGAGDHDDEGTTAELRFIHAQEAPPPELMRILRAAVLSDGDVAAIRSATGGGRLTVDRLERPISRDNELVALSLLAALAARAVLAPNVRSRRRGQSATGHSGIGIVNDSAAALAVVADDIAFALTADAFELHARAPHSSDDAADTARKASSEPVPWEGLLPTGPANSSTPASLASVSDCREGIDETRRLRQCAHMAATYRASRRRIALSAVQYVAMCTAVAAGVPVTAATRVGGVLLRDGLLSVDAVLSRCCGDASGAIVALEVQGAWADRLLNGLKTVETRTYALPSHLLCVPIVVLRSPEDGGLHAHGLGSGELVGIVYFASCSKYESRAAWAADVSRHCVDGNDSAFAWHDTRDAVPVYAWAVDTEKTVILPAPVAVPWLSENERIVRSLFKLCD